MQGFLLVPESIKCTLMNAEAKQILKWFKKAGIYIPKSFFDELKTGVYQDDADVDEMTDQMERALQGYGNARNFIIIVYSLSTIIPKYTGYVYEDSQATLKHILIELASHALSSRFNIEPIIQLVDLNAAANACPPMTAPKSAYDKCCI